MRSLWHEWPKIRRFLTGKRLILLLDYDGTLAPIAAHPSQAILPAPTRAALRQLARSPQVALGIVSGRALGELKRLVRLRDICYIGSHGLERALPGQACPPAFRRAARLPECGPAVGRATADPSSSLLRITRELRRALHGLPKVWIERKIAGVAVHYRGASLTAVRSVRAEVARVARRSKPEFQLLPGKKMFEFFPAGASTKGAAVRRLVARLRARSPRRVVIYLGDDTADESVFAELKRNDIGIFVGRPRRSRARFYLRSPGQVGKFLEQLRRVAS